MNGENGGTLMGSFAPRPWLSSLVCGCVLALSAVAAAPLAGMSIQWVPNGDSGDINVLTLFIGVLLTGWLLWWLIVGRTGHAGVLRGGVTGLVVACLSYPSVLFLAEFFQPDWQSRSSAPSLLERLENVFALSGFGLVTTGFAATIILALVGMSAGAVQGRLAGRVAEAAARPGIAGRAFRALAFGAAAAVVLLLAAFIWLSLLPMERLAPRMAFPPVTSYAQAVAAFAVVRQREAGMALHPRCGSMMLTHAERTERVVVFFHGLTNCPAQADELAPFLFAQGYNVLVPLLPGHGRADSLTLALADVTAEDLVETAESSIGLARGLGNEVIVLGLSAGGTMAAHQAQHDAAIGSAVAVAPFFAPSMVPQWAVQAATNLLLLMPNQMVWWDPRAPYSSQEMDYAYPRFATHALAQIMRLGEIVSAEADAAGPSTPQIGFLLNEADLAVNNMLAQRVAAAWRGHGHPVDVEVIPHAKRLPHDLIDPRQADAAIDIVYPILAGMISPGSP
jgi:alpha-beta hydrolase superfamily lysophospholipase